MSITLIKNSYIMKKLVKRILVLALLLTVSGLMQLSAQTQNYLTTSGNKLYDSAGDEVRLTGVNWFGFETSLYSPHGIWTRDMKSVLQQIKDLGFNTIRVPWCNEMLDPGASVNINPYGTDSYSGVSPMNEEEATVSTPIELLDIFVDWCQENNMKIVLDNHSRAADGFLNEAYWYTDEYSEERWINDWVFIAERYIGKSAVVAMDLNNEPHGSTWGNSDPSTDWNKAAERCGNAVLAVNPDVLIIVEGVGEFEGDSYWWGGQLKGAEKYPVVLSDPSKLVYSAHEYGPEVSQQDWFQEANFPQNMPEIWEEHYDYLYESNTSPIFVGEFGIRNQNAFSGIAYTWFTEFMDFMGDKYSWTFWTMNPNSGDTGGILQDDWTSVNQWKLDVLQPHVAPLIPNVLGNIIDENNPPVANFKVDNGRCGGSSVNFDGSLSSDPDGDTLTYFWDFGDGNTGTGETIFYNYSFEEMVDVTLTVSDGELSNSITYEVNLLPTPCAAPEIQSIEILPSEASGEVPFSIDLEAIITMYIGEVTDVNLYWDFDGGNGTTSENNQNASITFNEVGAYTVSLTGVSPANTVTTDVIITVTEPIVIDSDLSLNYKNGGNSATDNSINPHFEILNNGSSSVSYSDLTVRYWFTSEDSNSLNFWCDWAQLGTANVLGSFGEANGMNYLEVSFDSASGDLLANSSSGTIQNRFAKTNWSNFDESDDYSFDASKTAYTSHDLVTLYQGGNLVWGIEPNGASAKSLDKVVFDVFPNPTTDYVTITNSELNGAVVKVSDLSGKQHLLSKASSNSLTLDVSSFNSGLYVLELNTVDHKKQTKMIIVK